MSFIEGYTIFAFSTAIAACYFWFWPIMMQAVKNKVDNSFTKRPILSAVVYIIMTAIIAPLIVLPLLIPSYSEAFERGLRREMDKPE
jgi:ABC-type molybdate transport system permease subunit